ncbi:MAG: hypothetical protein AAF449_07555 [Myxococcota bacterium]
MSIFRPCSIDAARRYLAFDPEAAGRPVSLNFEKSSRRRVQTLCVLSTLLIGCFQGDFRERHASAVDRYLATPFIDEEAPFADPRRALGPPDGRTVALGVGAFIVLRFFRDIPDGPGSDMRVYEIGNDGSQARVAVSVDGDTFFEMARPALGTATTFDLDEVGVPFARFVRIRGTDDAGEEPGFDLDAVEALR